MKSFKKALRRLWPLLVTGGAAAVGSDSFRHYIATHPQFAPIATAVIYVLHTIDEKKTAGSA